MYQKVSTDMNFVEREKEVEKFWEDNQIFQKSMEEEKEVQCIHFTMDLRQLMVNHISVMC